MGGKIETKPEEEVVREGEDIKEESNDLHPFNIVTLLSEMFTG